MGKSKKPARASPGPASTADEVERQLERIRAVIAADDAAAPSAKMSANVRVKLSAEHRNWVKIKRDIEKAEAVTEDLIAQHPKWLELRDRIITSLVPFPDAAKAVAAALKLPL